MATGGRGITPAMALQEVAGMCMQVVTVCIVRHAIYRELAGGDTGICPMYILS